MTATASRMTSAVDVHHVSDGRPDAPVVVLAHAIGASLRMWDPQASGLARDFHVIRYDHRGHGSSPVPAGPYTIADLGSDLLALLDRLHVERAAICGLSLGAMAALWVASHAPDRVTRLIACCAVANAASAASWRERAATVRRGGTAAVADLVIERWGYRGRDPAIQGLIREMLLATPAEGYAACCDAIADMDLEPDLRAITAPTLVVAGGDDPAAPVTEMERVARLIPDARVAVIDGVAHLANVERPDAMTDAVRAHLAALREKERS
jgi:3-oxoadipate enol-lactonase